MFSGLAVVVMLLLVICKVLLFCFVCVLVLDCLLVGWFGVFDCLYCIGLFLRDGLVIVGYFGLDICS